MIQSPKDKPKKLQHRKKSVRKKKGIVQELRKSDLSKSGEKSGLRTALVTSDPAPNLEEDLRAIWNKDVNDLPVFKDLPRLAKRIVVLGSLSKDKQEWPLQFNETEPPADSDKKTPVFEIYLNLEGIKSNRASQWSKSYAICNLQLFKSSSTGLLVLRLFKKSETTQEVITYCQVSVDRILSASDSTRYFVLPDVYFDQG
eukprot:TRINITY_DN4506_c0_g1_i3.p1 TRINITY_DN4506_c0_g1~~TRINITY_DN4506_c0_g1_i3.p1  ORF type:complete len:229 (+),score=41.72 TRINITY_DN4506_c0_g1_i3:88-687(+)